jgi:deoxycytidylate deaminase
VRQSLKGMILGKNRKMLAVAKSVAHLSDVKQYKVGAVIANGKDILSVAHNKEKSHPLQKKYNQHRGEKAEEWSYLHAEVAAILKVRNKKLLKGSTIYVGRTFKSGHNAIARPCPACMQAIIDHGIKEIVYTTDDGLAVEVVILDDK